MTPCSGVGGIPQSIAKDNIYLEYSVKDLFVSICLSVCLFVCLCFICLCFVCLSIFFCHFGVFYIGRLPI